MSAKFSLSAQPTGKSITPSVSFPIALALSEKTEITVSGGEMKMTADGAVSFGTALAADGQVTIDWYINPDDTENAFVMTLRGALKSETLILAYNEMTDRWTFSRGEN